MTIRRGRPVEWSIDRRIAALAGRQKGRVARSQLLNAGVGPSDIDARIRRGALHIVRFGVYAVGHTAEPPFARETEAWLACGEDTAVCRRSSGRVWGMMREWEGDVEIATPRRIRRPGITPIRTTLDPKHVWTRHGMRLTSPAWTAIELAAVLDQDELEQTLATAFHRKLFHPSLLPLVINEAGTRPGLANLRAVIERQPRLTRSKAERLLINLLRRADLPLPEANVYIAGKQRDLVWREQRLIVEFDGWDPHRWTFEEDRRRDAVLVAQDWRVMRVTWRQLEDTPEATVARIAQALVSLRAA